MVLIQSRDKAYPVAAASLQSRSPLQHIAVYYITIILHYKYMNNYTYKYTYKYIIYIQMQIQMHMQIHYSLMRLVLPNTEELISRPFMGLYKIRLLLRDRMRTKNLRFFWHCFSSNFVYNFNKTPWFPLMWMVRFVTFVHKDFFPDKYL